MIPCALLLALAGAVQDAPPRPTFEVASIKASVDTRNASAMPNMPRAADVFQRMRPGSLNRKGNTIILHEYSLLNLISAAYKVKPDQIDGPSWMSETLWDVDAKLPEGVSVDSANEMLQALLAERFGLKAHRETREVSGYDLVVGKSGPKLT